MSNSLSTASPGSSTRIFLCVELRLSTSIFIEDHSRQGWCERGDSNPHGCPLDPKSSASASSATLARRQRRKNSGQNERVGNNSGQVKAKVAALQRRRAVVVICQVIGA